MIGPRILFVADSAPYPPRNGGAQRTALLLRALRGCGAVDFVFVNRAGVDERRLAVMREQHGMVASVTPWSPATTRAGRARVALHARMYHMAPLLGGMARAYAPDHRVSRVLGERVATGRYDVIVGRYLRSAASAGVLEHSPVILDLDDHDLGVYASRADVPGVPLRRRFLARRAVAQLRPLLPALLSRCAHVWVSTHEDLTLLDGVPGSVLMNIPFEPARAIQPAPAVPGSPILLVASMDYDVNARATERFVGSVWPLIRAACPAARLRIVGSGMSEAQRRRWALADGVDAVGPVDEIAPEYARASFAVAPLYEGGGTKIKVVEALRHARAIVVTRHAHRGVERLLPDGAAVLVADTEAQFAARCVELWHDPALSTRLAQHGSAVVSDHFGWPGFQRIVTDAVAGVLARPVPQRALAAHS